MDFVALKKVCTFSNIKKGFAKTCIIWPFNPNVTKGTTCFGQFQGNEKNIVSSNEEENNATYYTLQKIEEEEDIPTIHCQYYVDAIISDDEDYHLKGSFKITT
jgi:hypothetical protein